MSRLGVGREPAGEAAVVDRDIFAVVGFSKRDSVTSSCLPMDCALLKRDKVTDGSNPGRHLKPAFVA